MTATVDEPSGAWPFRRPGPPPEPPSTLTVHLVAHTHWDREWYASAEWFRRRLVVTVDRVLDLLAADPGWAFVLDGQAMVVEDYLAARPGRADELRGAVTAGRLTVGPWYVQPDSLLPAGEAHVRNLLEGRLACAPFGGASRVAYTPDSFGHPAWFPTLFAGFGLTAFVYWRGHGSERDRLPARWRWVAGDGAAVPAWHLEGSYLGAATLETEPSDAAARLRDLAAALAARSPGGVLVMNGVDHSMPDEHTAAVAAGLVALTGWTVRRTTLDDAVAAATAAGWPADTWTGPLMGARDANLLPGVWSSRLPLKLANRAVEAALWTAEHLCGAAALIGGPDERASLRRIRRTMLENQAHDSLGGCSVDAVHDQMAQRSAAAIAAAEALAAGTAEHLAGLGPRHLGPWSDEPAVAVWNPLPWPRRATVRIPVEGWPAFRVRAHGIERHPGHVASLDGRGFTVDGSPARVVDAADPHRDRFSPEHRLVDVEATVDLPALGWAQVQLGRGEWSPDVVDDGRALERGGAGVEVADDGTVTYTSHGRRWAGLLGVVDRGDRGDTYDRDLLDDASSTRAVAVEVVRRRHASGTGEIEVRRTFAVPQSLDDQRGERVPQEVPLEVRTLLSLAPDGRLDVDLTVTSAAHDHAVLLRLPVPHAGAVIATQFGAAAGGAARDTTGWIHPAPGTECAQGWVASGGLLVVAPGLPEVAVGDEGIDVTVLRAVGWMSRPDLRTRPGRASPAIPVPGAQTGRVEARLALRADPDDPALRWATLAEVERRPVAVFAGAAPLVAPDAPVLQVEGLVATALKPADDGDGTILRLWNPTDAPRTGTVRSAVPVRTVRCRLDESPLDNEDAGPEIHAGPHEIVTLRLTAISH